MNTINIKAELNRKIKSTIKEIDSLKLLSDTLKHADHIHELFYTLNEASKQLKQLKKGV